MNFNLNSHWSCKVIWVIKLVEFQQKKKNRNTDSLTLYLRNIFIKTLWTLMQNCFFFIILKKNYIIRYQGGDHDGQIELNIGEPDSSVVEHLTRDSEGPGLNTSLVYISISLIHWFSYTTIAKGQALWNLTVQGIVDDF